MEKESLEWVTTPASPEAESKFRRYLAELTERQGWVHHVADAKSGEVLTTPLDRPVAPLSRAERLSRFGPGFDPSIFGAPSYRLTARSHYQSSPKAWLRAFDADRVDPELDVIHFNDIVSDSRNRIVNALITELPQGRCVATVVLSGRSRSGQVGHVRVSAIGHGSIRVPLDQSFAEHTIDFIFVARADTLESINVIPEVGLRTLTFHSITLESQPVIVFG
jgi:hypothetical protein